MAWTRRSLSRYCCSRGNLVVQRHRHVLTPLLAKCFGLLRRFSVASESNSSTICIVHAICCLSLNSWVFSIPGNAFERSAIIMSDVDSTKERFEDDAKSDAKHPLVTVQAVDTAAAVASGNESELDPAEALRIRKKIDWHILPLMCTLYWIQFMDKTTLGSAAILGIEKDAHLTTSEYNWLGTVFYISYLIFEYPQNIALQRFPVAKWLSLNVTIWGIVLMCHAACTSFTGLLVVRILLGVCEGSIISAFMIVSSMFYTRNEQTLRVGYWFLMNGIAQIISGFISYGSLHINSSKLHPWQWLMLICGIITLVEATAFWFLFPDSPTTAWFLTPDERVKAVLRLRENQTGVENKVFKREQMIEALTDPKTWLFALFSALDNIPNSLTNQRQLIVSGFGFSILQTTLLGCVDGAVEMITIFTGVNIVARIPNSRAYVGVIYMVPNLVGTLMINLLPWSNKYGLLAGVWISGVGVTGFVISLSWLTSVTAGHTKRVTTNAIMLIAFCVGNAAGPFMWQTKYKPRNRIPWIIIGICYLCSMGLLLAIRYVLDRENKRRDMEPHDDTYDRVYVTKETPDGRKVEVKVAKEFLDLTDRQNRDFRYVL